MKEIVLEERKKIMVDILQEFHNFCIKNNLKYSIWYGTAIGAIRHKGFIPWDDDIDVVMPREDYNKFKKIYDSNKQKYILYKEKTRNYHYLYCKLCDIHSYSVSNILIDTFGIFIDIFPLDKISLMKLTNENTRRKFADHVLYSEFKFNKRIAHLKNKNVISKIIGLFKIILLILFRWVQPIILYIFIQKSKGDDGYLCMCPFDENKTMVGCNAFNELIDVLFCEGTFKIFSNYDVYLKNIYGDYMIPPPFKERFSHPYHFYKKDN